MRVGSGNAGSHSDGVGEHLVIACSVGFVLVVAADLAVGGGTRVAV